MSSASAACRPMCSIASSTLPRSTKSSRRGSSACSSSVMSPNQLSRRPTLTRTDSRTVTPLPWADRDAFSFLQLQPSHETIEEEQHQQRHNDYDEDECIEDDGYAGDDDYTPGTWHSRELESPDAQRRNGFESVREAFERFESHESEKMNHLRNKLRHWQASNWAKKGRVEGGPKLVWIRSNSSTSSSGSAGL